MPTLWGEDFLRPIDHVYPQTQATTQGVEIMCRLNLRDYACLLAYLLIATSGPSWAVEYQSHAVESTSDSAFDPELFPKLAIIVTDEAHHHNSRSQSQSNAERFVEDEFMPVLLKKGYSIATRSDVQAIVKEQRFQRSGLTESDATKIGKILNVPAVLIVGITEMGSVSKRLGRRELVEGRVSIGARLIGVETAKVLWIGKCSRARPLTTGTDASPLIGDVAKAIALAMPPRKVSKTGSSLSPGQGEHSKDDGKLGDLPVPEKGSLAKVEPPTADKNNPAAVEKAKTLLAKSPDIATVVAPTVVQPTVVRPGVAMQSVPTDPVRIVNSGDGYPLCRVHGPFTIVRTGEYCKIREKSGEYLALAGWAQQGTEVGRGTISHAPESGGLALLWKIEPLKNGSWTISNRTSGKCLDEKENRIGQSPFREGALEQQWRLEPVRSDRGDGTTVVEPNVVESPVARPTSGRDFFVGEWKIVEPGKRNKEKTSMFSLRDDGSSKVGRIAGKWECVNGEAHIHWNNGCTDVIRGDNGGFKKLTFNRGASLDAKPDHTGTAEKQPPK
jgi:hypothetical protein